MVLLVPFDGGDLAVAALRRAAALSGHLDQPVVAVTVVRNRNAEAARGAGWLADGEPFDLDVIVGRLREQVRAEAPDAEFVYETVDRHAPTGVVSRRIRRTATDREASMVVIGSDNAGRIVTSVSSLGRSLAAENAYDVLIVRSP